MATAWDVEENKGNLVATGSERTFFTDLCENIRILDEFKFEPYQPLQYPPKPRFTQRIKKWVIQFAPNHQKYMFYLSTKIVFLTHLQIINLMGHLFQNKIKKIILEDIIIEKNLPPFSYKAAEKYFDSELKKTLFVGLTDSSRINEFTHVNDEIIRPVSTGLELETLLFPSKMKLKFFMENGEKKKICDDFEKEILLEHSLVSNKDRLIILEDFSGSGDDAIKNLDSLNDSFLSFKKIIFAPYIITHHACKELDAWIEEKRSDGKYEYSYTYGTLISEDMKCFDFDNSYLKSEWKNQDIDICNEIKEACKLIYGIYYPPQPDKYLYGYGKLKLAFATYYNCPDNSLPILWCDGGNWAPLLKRASRYEVYGI